MPKKLKVWLNNKLNKRLRCTVVIKFYRIFITELVLNFFKIKNSGNSWGEWGGGHQRPPGTENPGRWGGVQIKESSVVGVWIFSGTTQ